MDNDKAIYRAGLEKAVVIRVVGVVQGVGFRPFIHRLATRLGLNGYVRNLGGAEVEIYVEGSKEAIAVFLEKLMRKRPPPAKIEDLRVENVEPRGSVGFKILPSSTVKSQLSMIPPDFGICEDCLREVLASSSRWYKYPFNSCAWCGPRFTIMETIPYDRENTAMRDFPLCGKCVAEYSDPGNLRRFHAQGISCPRCGPRLTLIDPSGRAVDVKDPVAETVKMIEEGLIIAVKGLGGFHLAALASDDAVVLKLRKRKGRPSKPLALMALNLNVASKLIIINEVTAALLSSLEKPIVVAPKRVDSPVSRHVAPGLRTLGVMLPYTALHYMLLNKTRDKFLIMTSGNPSGLPICVDEKEAVGKLKGVADYFLVHNRRIVNRADDSVIRLTDGKPVFLRRSRGYAPLWLKIPFKLTAPIIAFGPMLASTGAVALDSYVIPTQHIGDVENLETLKFLEKALGFLTKCYRVNPTEAVFATDMHPLYPSRRLAERLAKLYGAGLVTVQHHHAHIAALMLEQGVPTGKEVLGVAVDGTGYGEDGRIWGGEVIRASYASYTRLGHIKYYPLPGGDAAVKYPVRSLIGLLSTVLEEEELRRLAERLRLADGLPRGDLELDIVVRQAYSGKSPLTSSTGRMFDAAAALLKICQHMTYEGEPAIHLEEYAGGRDLGFKAPVEARDRVITGDGGALVLQLAYSVLEGRDPRSLALSFQLAVGRMLGEIVLKYLKRGDREVFLSGGASVNNYLVKGLKETIGDRARLMTHSKLPPGDGGVSAGQAVIAAFKAGFVKQS